MDSYMDQYQPYCDLVCHSFDLHVFLIDTGGKIIYEASSQHGLNPLYANQNHHLFTQLNLYSTRSYAFPLITKSVFSEKYILVSIFRDQTFAGTVLIGPALSHPVSDEVVNGIIHDARGFFYRDQVHRYYKSLPVIEHERLIYIGIIVFQLFNQILLDPAAVREKNGKVLDAAKLEKTELMVSQHLQTHTFHERLFEKKMLEIIKEGRVDELKHLPVLKEEEVASVLSKSSYFRSNKNHIITLIALVSRAAIEGGLHEEIAFSLHDRFIQQLEETTTLDEVRDLAKEVLYTYADKVRQAKNEKYSRTIASCKNYIYKHIYSNIGHEELAAAVELSPKYLSVLFKKEVGITVSDYIQQTRIAEAKKLLAYSKTPISEICTLLNFNDQSYFTKVFKKVTGVTPKFYRERHRFMEKKTDNR
ncbi:helix-turn-helix domain-containing protein [Paenibacillus sp. CN-4]|uniref:helix-turn-helix domain-containing protein n=1 Tax=Paenibacillus nanchangensis TaxID=3348343 RepID=UPI00397CFC55